MSTLFNFQAAKPLQCTPRWTLPTAYSNLAKELAETSLCVGCRHVSAGNPFGSYHGFYLAPLMCTTQGCCGEGRESGRTMQAEMNNALTRTKAIPNPTSLSDYLSHLTECQKCFNESSRHPDLISRPSCEKENP